MSNTDVAVSSLEVQPTSSALSDRRAALAALSFRRIGAVYVWLLIIVLFSFWSPDLFPKMATVRAIANDYSISGLAALAILLPMASGTFDVSIGGNMSLAGVTSAWLLVHTHLSIELVALLTVAVGVVIGLVNSLVVVTLRIPSLIGTLAIGGIADALSIAVSGNQTLSSPALAGPFSRRFAQINWDGFTIPVLFVLVVTAILGVILSQTSSGRYMYAVGFEPQVSRLAGIRVNAIRTAALVSSGAIAAFAGMVLAAHVASASPNGGDAYLLPAFAAVFLGATQFRAKRFNAVGTLIAVFMLGTGQYGLLLVGAPQWSPNIFQGVALIAAIGLTHLGGPGNATRRQVRSGRRTSRAAAA